MTRRRLLTLWLAGVCGCGGARSPGREPTICPNCQGAGKTTCLGCSGTGEVARLGRDLKVEGTAICSMCQGAGGSKCLACNGKGKY